MSPTMQQFLKIRSETPIDVQEEAVKQLIKRLFPTRFNEFEVHLDLSLLENDNKDKFVVRKIN